MRKIDIQNKLRRIKKIYDMKYNKFDKTIKIYFIDNYNEEIKDGDLVCTDLIYYSKD